MSLSDPIGDMIARVKNAQARNHKKVELPSSNFKTKIADILKNEGFIKDFRGLSQKGFDKFGNYTFGIKEHIIFPEVSFDRADKVRGLDIIIVIKTINKEHSFALLEKMNFPFIKKGDN